jgi:hypothetical protein
MLREHWAPAEADLARYYGMDLCDVIDGSLSLRKVAVLLDGLPPDSLWWTTIRQIPGPKATGSIDTIRWSTTHELLASVVDATNDVAWTLRQVNSKKKVPPPPRFPRPGTAPKKHSISKENMARLEQWRAANRPPEVNDGH